MVKDEELKVVGEQEPGHSSHFAEFNSLGPDFACWCRSEKELLAVAKIDQFLYSAKHYLTREDDQEFVMQAQCESDWELFHVHTGFLAENRCNKIAEKSVELVRELFPHASGEQLNRLANLLVSAIMKRLEPVEERPSLFRV
jgi:hypothetical protein